MSRRRVQQLTERFYLYEGAVTRGMLANSSNNGVLFIDTGLEPRNGRQLVRAAQEQNWEIAGILTTHVHADHFGGHAAVVEEASCPVYASRLARPVLEYPLWEPIMLFGGASPPDALRDKFFVAPVVGISAVVAEDKALPSNLEQWKVRVLELPGHSHGMTGYAADNVVYCGDAFLEPRLLDKHGVPALVDVEAALGALRRLRDEIVPDSAWLVASHGGAYSCPEVRKVLDTNRSVIESQLELVLEELEKPKSMDQIVSSIAQAVDRELRTPGDAALVRTTVGAYLTYLEAEGEVETVVKNRLCSWTVSE
jgi:glyoxylase-like metal-dependent hydrolase (beta-lactamase superfamily II)